MNDLNIISELLDAPIAFNPSFARIVDNNLAAGILLSQLFYWAKVMNFNEFYKINEELQQECFLGRSEFENARKKILKTGVFTTIKKGIPCRTYYQINLNVLISLLSNLKYIKLDNQFTGNLHTSRLESSNQEYNKFSSQNVKNKQAIINNKEYSQNTTEITSDNTSDTPLPPKGGLD
ncbi:MAG TPA: hypothetical protein PKD00_02585 [Burkholderiales bacterium]|nr:hypothetical protein [Burkholderiales bacterium]